MSHSQSPPSILWFQLIGLSLIQGAITLTWLLYRLYLPQLLADFGFAGLSATILIIENALGIILEPVAGNFSDRQRYWMGTRFPFISLGVILASGLFIAIPTFFIFGQSFKNLYWIFPVLLILWSVAMALFRSPATALLAQYAIDTKLPQAMSLLIFVGGIVGAIRPISSEFILSLGAGITFTLGSIVLLSSVGILRAFNPDLTVFSPVDNSQKKLYLKHLILIGILGFFMALATRLLLGEFAPKVIQSLGVNVKWMMFTGLLLLAFASIPAGLIAVKIGNHKATLIGLIATAVLLVPLTFISHPILFLLILLLIVSYSFVANGIIPIAFSLVPSQKAGLGIGIYFGAFSLAMAGYDLIVKQPGKVNLFVSSALGIMFFLTLAIVIRLIPKLTFSNQTV